MADQDNTPVFQIQRVYLKDLSLEQPNSPAILLEQEQPSVDIQLGVEAAPVADGIYEICVTATVQTKIKEKTVFLVEAKQAGIFEVRNIPEDQMGAIMGIAWPKSTSRPCTNSSNKPQRPTPLWPSKLHASWQLHWDEGPSGPFCLIQERKQL